MSGWRRAKQTAASSTVSALSAPTVLESQAHAPDKEYFKERQKADIGGKLTTAGIGSATGTGAGAPPSTSFQYSLDEQRDYPASASAPRLQRASLQQRSRHVDLELDADKNKEPRPGHVAIDTTGTRRGEDEIEDTDGVHEPLVCPPAPTSASLRNRNKMMLTFGAEVDEGPSRGTSCCSLDAHMPSPEEAGDEDREQQEKSDEHNEEHDDFQKASWRAGDRDIKPKGVQLQGCVPGSSGDVEPGIPSVRPSSKVPAMPQTGRDAGQKMASQTGEKDRQEGQQDQEDLLLPADRPPPLPPRNRKPSLSELTAALGATVRAIPPASSRKKKTTRQHSEEELSKCALPLCFPRHAAEYTNLVKQVLPKGRRKGFLRKGNANPNDDHTRTGTREDTFIGAGAGPGTSSSSGQAIGTSAHQDVN
eukprot:GSA25T00008272001.1